MSAQVEEVVASSEALSDMAQSLKQAVSVFKIEEETGAGTNGSSPTPGPAGVQYTPAPQGSVPMDEELAMSH